MNPTTLIFSVVQVTWTSPNYRFITLHFEQRSALKCCISEKEREMTIFNLCKMTLLHWPKPFLCNSPAFAEESCWLLHSCKNIFLSCTQPQLMVLQSRDSPSEGGCTLPSLVPPFFEKREFFEAIFFPTHTNHVRQRCSSGISWSVLSHGDQQLPGSHRACWLQTSVNNITTLCMCSRLPNLFITLF